MSYQAKFDEDDMEIATDIKPLWECSEDGYWGVGVHLLSNNINNGRWSGQNVFGQMLMEVRREKRANN